MLQFCTIYIFRNKLQHHTSSRRFPQSNGAAEKAVQTAISLLKKLSDPFLALWSYRTTPLNNGMSPAQLLMGRQLRSTVPTTKIVLQPSTPNIDKLQQDDKRDKLRQSTNYNKCHALVRENSGIWETNFGSQICSPKQL